MFLLNESAKAEQEQEYENETASFLFLKEQKAVTSEIYLAKRLEAN